MQLSEIKEGQIWEEFINPSAFGFSFTSDVEKNDYPYLLMLIVKNIKKDCTEVFILDTNIEFRKSQIGNLIEINLAYYESYFNTDFEMRQIA